MQVRKGTQVPYVAHLIAVSALVLEANGTESEAVGALLHDAAEDQGGEPRLLEIESSFGADVARIVRDCSDTLASEKAPWLIRKTIHLEHLRGVPADSFIVALADRVHNAQSLAADLSEAGPLVWTRFNAPPSLQLRILQKFADLATTRAHSSDAYVLDSTALSTRSKRASTVNRGHTNRTIIGRFEVT